MTSHAPAVGLNYFTINPSLSSDSRSPITAFGFPLSSTAKTTPTSSSSSNPSVFSTPSSFSLPSSSSSPPVTGRVGTSKFVGGTSTTNTTTTTRTTTATTTTKFRPGFIVHRKDLSPFGISPSRSGSGVGKSALSQCLKDGAEAESEARAKNKETGVDGINMEDEVTAQLRATTIGLSELIEASKGKGRPPRVPIAQSLGFDVVPKPSLDIIGLPENTFSSPLTPMKSPPRLSTSVETAVTSSSIGSTSSTYQYARNHPHSRQQAPRTAFKATSQSQFQEEMEEWHLVTYAGGEESWINIEPSSDEEDELLFLDDEELHNNKEENKFKEEHKLDEVDKEEAKMAKRSYAGVLRD